FRTCTTSPFGRACATPPTTARAAAASGRGWRSRRIGLYVGDSQISPRQAGSRLNDACRKFHAAEVLVSGGGLLDEHVAGDSVFDSRFDLIQHVLGVNITADRVCRAGLGLRFDWERHDREFLAVYTPRCNCRIGRAGGELEETWRRKNHVELLRPIRI